MPVALQLRFGNRLLAICLGLRSVRQLQLLLGFGGGRPRNFLLTLGFFLRRVSDLPLPLSFLCRLRSQRQLPLRFLSCCIGDSLLLLFLCGGGVSEGFLVCYLGSFTLNNETR